ncbi:hypothetical protein D7V88_27760 [Corallococcus terminator]|uniref:Type I restriction modification DNA specificity domain-containing protein n=2 Tax=Corallococcus terminator TaxID=2316733 RepID=A0A3A8IK18_9BACT|nr:hypothetical protein D7V88_27760 [Corallococcus terminator]
MESLTTKLGAGSTPLGGKKVYKSAGITFLRSQNVWNDGLRLTDVALIDLKTHKDMRGTWVEPGDVLLNITGASIGRSAVVPDGFDAANVSQHVAIIRLKDKALRRFVHLCIISPYFQKRVMDVQVGVSREGLSMKRLREFPLPLPPVGEQARIVSRVEQLFALCDQLEAKQVRKSELSKASTSAALSALTKAESSDDRAVALRRINDNFDELFDALEAVAEFRRALRVLAVRGWLAPQVADEGDGTGVVRKLQADLGAHRIDWADVDPIKAASDAGISIPRSWAWVRLENTALFGPRNGYSPKAVEFETQTKSLTLTATTSGQFNGQHFKYIDEAIPADSSLWLEDGDLLVQRSNTIEYVGASAIYRGPPRTFIYPDLMMKLRLSPAIDLDWVHMVLSAETTRAYFRARASGTAGSMPKINQGVVAGAPIPVPPLDEQRRIVQRLIEMMRVCDVLEEKIQLRAKGAQQLAEALVASIALPEGFKRSAG